MKNKIHHTVGTFLKVDLTKRGNINTPNIYIYDRSTIIIWLSDMLTWEYLMKVIPAWQHTFQQGFDNFRKIDKTIP
jgi:hypothetical protein